MIFISVGTSFPFDRLVKAMDEFAGRGELTAEFFAQVGIGGYVPKHFPSVETLDKEQFDMYFDKAEALIAHAGMGTITMALQQQKPILVMPRLKKYGELVNDHQLATARRFEKLGHILAAYNEGELETKILSLTSFRPVPRESQAEQVCKYISTFLHSNAINSLTKK